MIAAATSVARIRPSVAPVRTQVRPEILQQCGEPHCSGPTSGDEFEHDEGKELHRYARSDIHPGHDFGGVDVLGRRLDGPSELLSVSRPKDASEQEADRFARQVAADLAEEPASSGGSSRSEEPSPESSSGPSRTPAGPPAAPEPGRAPAPDLTNPAPEQAAAEAESELSRGGEPGEEGALIVEDDAESVAPGQMRKAPFLAELRAAVCATAEESLAEVGRTAKGCPYIERWFAHYQGQSAAHGERALRRYAPGARDVTAARDYIPAVCVRVRMGISTWAATGDLSAVPEELPAELPGGAGGILSELGGGLVAAVSGIGRAVGSAVSDVSSLFTKLRPGEASRPPASQHGGVLQQLGSGRPLDPGVRAPFEHAFGQSFTGVRVHTDGSAARLADGLAARAFTVSNHVAFAQGEYRPGTLVGDAILAHELAHVVQQCGDASRPLEGESGHETLEQDADLSAVGAVASVWSLQREQALSTSSKDVERDAAVRVRHESEGLLARLARRAMPRVRSGLNLQRCARQPAPTCAMPVNVRNGPFHQAIDDPGDVGMEIAISITSSTGKDSDMAAIEDSERVGLSFNHTGSFVGLAPLPSSQSGFMPGYPIPNDRHTAPRAMIIDRADNHGGNGSLDKHQLDIFKAPACGVTTPKVIPQSGYLIKRIIEAGPGTRIKFKTEKSPAACTVNGHTTGAGPSPTQSDEVVVRP